MPVWENIIDIQVFQRKVLSFILSYLISSFLWQMMTSMKELYLFVYIFFCFDCENLSSVGFGNKCYPKFYIFYTYLTHQSPQVFFFRHLFRELHQRNVTFNLLLLSWLLERLSCFLKVKSLARVFFPPQEMAPPLPHGLFGLRAAALASVAIAYAGQRPAWDQESPPESQSGSSPASSWQPVSRLAPLRKVCF